VSKERDCTRPGLLQNATKLREIVVFRDDRDRDGGRASRNEDFWIAGTVKP
jgi:hypothetical protein